MLSRLSSGVIFGLIGMVTGVFGLYLAYQAQHEQQVVSVVASPSAGPGDLTASGLGVRVQLVNQSLRPVVVQGASLWEGKVRVADASGYDRDVRVLALATAARGGELAPFPLNLGAREGWNGALLLDVWNGVAANDPAAVGKLNLTLGAIGPAASLYPPFELELDLSPGGARRYALQMRPAAGAAQEATPDVATATQSNWLVTPLGRPPKLLGLLLRDATAGVDEVDLARLDLWKQGSAQQRSIVRPVIGEQATAFPLAGLAPGAYTATFSVGGKVVADRSFSMPWRRERCDIGLQEQAGPNGVGSPAWCS